MAITYEAFAHPYPPQPGDAREFKFVVASLEIQGKAVELPETGVTAFVGGNNVGKSTLLRQLHEWIKSETSTPLAVPPVVTAVKSVNSGSSSDVLSWLYAHRPTGMQGAIAGVIGPFGVLQSQSAVHYWTQSGDTGRLSQLGSAIVHYAGTQERFQMSQPTSRRNEFTEPPTHPLQRLEDDPALMEELSRISREAFHQELVLDPLSGQLLLRVGTPSVKAPPIDSVTPEYREALAQLRPLHEQGDGMRSMIGLLLPIITSTFPVVLVDEPEAFLHPPQARILGRELARLAEARQIQIVVATHDKNIVTGLLDAPSASISVVRLTRQGDRTGAAQLPADQLRSVWANPALRYSNILDGLFHRAVVLAENERDCRYFAATLDSLNQNNPTEISPDDMLFVPTAGKANFKQLATTMKACGVPTVICADLDLLNDEQAISGVVTALAGDWMALERDYSACSAQFQQPRTVRQKRDVLGAIETILADGPEQPYDSATKKRVSAALSVDSPWRALKDYGMNAFHAERARANGLVESLDAIGVVLVLVGELEGFAPDLGVAKGPAWVPAAIAAGAHQNTASREHVARLVTSAVQQESGLLAETPQS